MKKFALLIFLFSSFYSINIQSQCDIGNLSIELSPCIGTDTFIVQLNFDIVGGVSDSFLVNGNGQFYGDFSYGDLPISFVGLFSDCDQAYEFVVSDLANPDCNTFVDDIDICCSPDPDCSIANLNIFQVNCMNDSSYQALFSFNHQNPNSSGFDIFVNGVFSQYTDASPPFTLENIPLSDDFYQTLMVCENDNPNCCDYYLLRNPFCEENCTLRDLTWTLQDSCFDQGEPTSIEINFLFDADEVGSSFRITGNGINYGNYGYDELPVTIQTTISCDFNYEIRATDNDLFGCSTSANLGLLCCQSYYEDTCTIAALYINEIECMNDSSYSAQFNFNYQNIDSTGFDIFVNGDFFEFTNAYPPFTVENIPFTDAFFQTLTVCENDDPDCCATYEFRNPRCDKPCTLRDLTWTIQDTCYNQGDSIGIEINFLYDPDQVGQIFSLKGNGRNYGNFFYGELPVTIYPEAICGLSYEIEARDTEFNQCFVAADIGTVCCQINNDTCSIENLEISFIECGNDDQYWVNIDMDYDTTTSGQTFQVNINGNFIGSYPLSLLPMDLSVPIGNEIDHFTICQNNIVWCCESVRLTVPDDCFSDCEIRDFVVETTECDSNGQFNAVIDFIHNDVSDYFHLLVNQIAYGTYNYSQLPLTVGDFQVGDSLLIFNVIDSLSQCEGMASIISPDCNNSNDCEINDMLVRPFACDDNQMFDLFLNFVHNRADNERFTVSVNGNVFESYSYGDLPLIFGQFVGDGSDYHILVSDAIDGNCAEDLNIQAPDCSDCNQECGISALVVETIACENDSFYVILDFDFENVGQSGFTVQGNGNIYGSFDYNNLPIEIGPLASNCDLDLEFIITDNENPDCSADIDAGVICCQSPVDCAIEELDVEITECDSQFVNAIINLEHSNTANEYSFILLNGNFMGQAQYQDLPLDLGPIQMTSTPTDYEFTIIDSLDTDCNASVTIELSCDDPSPIPRVQINVQDGILDIMMERANVDPLNVMVISANGQLVQTNRFAEQTTNHRVPLQTTQIGVYFVRIFHESHLYYKKFVFSE